MERAIDQAGVLVREDRRHVAFLRDVRIVHVGLAQQQSHVGAVERNRAVRNEGATVTAERIARSLQMTRKPYVLASRLTLPPPRNGSAKVMPRQFDRGTRVSSSAKMSGASLRFAP
jgi:hypothetical protein